jgi:hypothetical protein
MSGFTREHLRRLGYVPDGQGGMMKIEDAPAAASEVNVYTTTPKDKMNSVEKRWHDVLIDRHPKSVIIPQFRLRVGDFNQQNPVHYTADFAVWTRHERVAAPIEFWSCTLWECKDKRRPYHSDELTRPKLVRQQNPFVGQVMLATWTGETWEERILA